MNSLVLHTSFIFMKRNILLLIAVFCLLSFTSCIVSKQYVQYISSKEEIIEPQTKNVLVFATENVRVNEFSKTFQKNFTDKKEFTASYLNDFLQEAKSSDLFSNVSVDVLNSTYSSLNTEYVDYVIHFSNFEISNRIEFQQTGGMGMNGMGGMQSSTSIEYCVISVKVEIYDTINNKEILDFVVIGEEAVFLFNFTKTLQKAKERSITHIINYLKSGKTQYEKY
ncbi:MULTISPECIES: hypothetical protein [unclassified Polaribacter]|uniref:hypothetical protein n=1 Tax=unclassified Polaribacter TaxID=196858 RepID=UPI0011BF4353|nr:MULTISPECIES: hypothetical protein [unclassified Polaribacter]TXD53955.1 hypothetical protein ES043_02715 [Polaribacter sp. IC063]TXD59664.1 hypothetical protein ES044_09430 [Polaribacter sp. IC066]